MVVMPSPVAVLSGDTKSPSDWRAPIVTMRIAAAAKVTVAARLPMRRLSPRPGVELKDGRHLTWKPAGHQWPQEEESMRVTREQAAENHDRIVETAARLFRERGFEGVGVAELMQAAGLTHGGFYGHFESKEDLMERACERALEGSTERWRRRADGARGPAALRALARGYLTERHRDDPGNGCLLASLGPDAARHGPGVRRAITRWL